jgi:hypothetical protein
MPAGQFIVQVVLPAVGILLLVLIVAALPFNISTAYKDKVQHIKAFGVDLDISVLTLLVLVALTLSLTGAFFLSRDYEQRLAALSELPAKLSALDTAHRVELARAKQVDVIALITLDGLDVDHAPEPKELSCTLRLHGGAGTKELEVSEGVLKAQYSVLLENLTAEERIRTLQCKTKDGRAWFIDKFNPLEPEYELKRR